MARKAKEGTLDLYYLNSNNDKQKLTRTNKNSPSKSKKNATNKKDTVNSDVFSFDDEIVLGINASKNQNRKPKQKNKNLNNKTQEKAKKQKTTKNKKQNKNIVNNNEESEKFDFDNEIVIGVNVIPDPKKEEKKKNVKKHKQKKAKKQPKQIIDEPKDRVEKKVDSTVRDKHKKNYKVAKRVLKIFLVLVLFIGVAIFLLTSPMFNVTKINVSGNSKISENEIISFSQIQTPINTYKISLLKVEENIKENAYIENVKVNRKLPNEINIQITERKPQFMLKFGNAYVYLSSQGYMLEISEEKIDAKIISGYKTPEENIKPGNRLIQEDLKKLEVVLKIIESATNNDIATYISEIDISNEDNYTLILESKNKIAYLGDGTSITDKIIILKQMIIKEEGKSGKAFLEDKDKMYFREE